VIKYKEAGHIAVVVDTLRAKRISDALRDPKSGSLGVFWGYYGNVPSHFKKCIFICVAEMARLYVLHRITYDTTFEGRKHSKSDSKDFRKQCCSCSILQVKNS